MAEAEEDAAQPMHQDGDASALLAVVDAADGTAALLSLWQLSLGCAHEGNLPKEHSRLLRTRIPQRRAAWRPSFDCGGAGLVSPHVRTLTR